MNTSLSTYNEPVTLIKAELKQLISFFFFKAVAFMEFTSY